MKPWAHGLSILVQSAFKLFWLLRMWQVWEKSTKWKLDKGKRNLLLINQENAPVALANPMSKCESLGGARGQPQAHMRTEGGGRKCKSHPLNGCYDASKILTGHYQYVFLEVYFKCELECYCHHGFCGPIANTGAVSWCFVSCRPDLKNRSKVKCAVWTWGILDVSN